MKKTLILLSICSLFILSCASFVEKSEVNLLKELEKTEYRLKKDVVSGDKTLKKGSSINIKFNVGKEWIKVYGYLKNVDPLKAEHVLILYVFEDEFSKKKGFEMAIFKNRLNEFISIE